LSYLYNWIITPAEMTCREMIYLMDSGICARKFVKPWTTHKRAWGSEGFLFRGKQWIFSGGGQKHHFRRNHGNSTKRTSELRERTI